MLLELIAAHGYEIVTGAALGGAALTTGARTGLDDPSKHAPSPQHVLDLLKAWRPGGMAHDDFVQHMAAIKAALGPDRDEHFDAVLEWAPGARADEYDATLKVWDSIEDTALGWDWLASASGTDASAQADFDDAAAGGNAPDPEEKALVPVFAEYVFNLGTGEFHSLEKNMPFSKDNFNAANTSIAPYGSTGRATAAATFINSDRGRRVDTSTFRPGADVILVEEIEGVQVRAVNRWRPSSLVPMRGKSPTPWLDHVAMLFPETSAREHFLNWLAFNLQRPGVKIGHAIVLYSATHGVGKDTALVPLLRGVGQHNVAQIAPEDLTSNFNQFLRAQLIVCNEMANFEKKSTYNRLKAYLAAPPHWLTVNEKNTKPYMVPNIQNWAFNTNHANAIALEDSDRRFWIHECECDRATPEHFARLWAWLNEGGGDAMTVGWLLDRDLAAFNPSDPPPMTRAKQDMADLSRPPTVRWLDEQFAEGGLFHGRTLVTAGEVTEAASGFDAPPIVTQTMHSGHVTAALRKHAFVAVPGRHRVGAKVLTIWTRDGRPEIMGASGEFLAARLAADQKKKGAA